jgi:hypothetical protein
MPDYDEYGMSYKDRSALLTNLKVGIHFKRLVCLWTQRCSSRVTIQGTWKDEADQDYIVISPSLPPFVGIASKKFNKALIRYASFFEKKLRQSK